jgi:hypothetical protein
LDVETPTRVPEPELERQGRRFGKPGFGAEQVAKRAAAGDPLAQAISGQALDAIDEAELAAWKADAAA